MNMKVWICAKCGENIYEGDLELDEGDHPIHKECPLKATPEPPPRSISFNEYELAILKDPDLTKAQKCRKLKNFPPALIKDTIRANNLPYAKARRSMTKYAKDEHGNPRYWSVAEQKIGRSLAKGEQVHHVNLRKTDDRPDNLFVCADKREHIIVHNNLTSLISELIDTNVIAFDPTTKTYFVNSK